jgi:hypothetical protein
LDRERSVKVVRTSFHVVTLGTGKVTRSYSFRSYLWSLEGAHDVQVRIRNTEPSARANPTFAGRN